MCLEDIAVIVIENLQTIMMCALISEMAQRGIAAQFVTKDTYPAANFCPFINTEMISTFFPVSND
ncbi:hypothetical protein MASR2M17_08750 [Aminivibrio sp.]